MIFEYNALTGDVDRSKWSEDFILTTASYLPHMIYFLAELTVPEEDQMPTMPSVVGRYCIKKPPYTTSQAVDTWVLVHETKAETWAYVVREHFIYFYLEEEHAAR